MRKRKATAKEKQQYAINLSRKNKLANQLAIQLQNRRGGDPDNLLRSQKSQTTSSSESIKQDARRFYGCYLLTSLSPRFKGHSYIGFTVNPKRRIRQHNGEISSGASQTKKKRPWEMVLCIHGFPSNVAALKFEWAWQNPKESVVVREAAASFKTLGGLANKIKLALTMLTLHSWQSMNLTVSFFSTKYMKHASGCPSLPHQMKLQFCSMDELPCYRKGDRPNDQDDEDDFDSNDNEISANYSDDRLETSADNSMETNLSSFHVQRCTVQNPSDNILAGDHPGTGGSLENESSSAMGVVEEYIQPMHQLPVDASGSSFMGDLEEHMQPMYQFPVDVSGSPLNTWNDLFFPGEEFWIENDRDSFLDVEERLLLIDGVNASEIEVLPALGEKQSFGHLSVDVPASTCNESEANEFKGSVDVNEEHIQPFQQADPSEREQSTMIGSASVIEDAADKDEISCIVIDDIAEEQYQSKRVRSPFRSVNPYRTFSTEGIEVIQLCSPSPDLRITAGSKKKRVHSGFPGFIDLTRSPSFIQL